MMEDEEFYNALLQEILLKADSEGKLLPEAFFETYTDELINMGDIPEAHYVHYQRDSQGSLGAVRIDGHSGDPWEMPDQSLSLFVMDFNQTDVPESITQQRITPIAQRLARFVDLAMEDNFRNVLEPTDPTFGLADLISNRWENVGKINLYILTNNRLNVRVDRMKDVRIRDKFVSLSVLDLNRLEGIRSSQKEREDMVIDFENEFEGGISALDVSPTSDKYKSYLAVITGQQLADIYEKWGDRLLEQNVRVFLQARNKVNRGLRNTLTNEPDMFFAFNNGLTATAEAIDICSNGATPVIQSLTNFQIVNGGQTTGSIFAAQVKSEDISKVRVQMKISIIEPDLSETIVPMISQYANSQNSVNSADLSSNHPFHIAIEGFSRRIFTPNIPGSLRQTKWFYERARGSYKQSVATLGRRFEEEYPTNQKTIRKYKQLINKTDLAKYLNLWQFGHCGGAPIVSLGAQKNYVRFMDGCKDCQDRKTSPTLDKQWEKNPEIFNELYYKELISKTIIFKATESIVSDSDWYEPGGPRAQIVAYAISKIAWDIKEAGKYLDFDRVWQLQDIFPELKSAIQISAYEVMGILANTGKPGQLVSEWAKSDAAWTRAKKLKVKWPTNFISSWVDKEAYRELQDQSVATQKIDSGIEAQKKVLDAGSDYWTEVINWGQVNGAITEQELNLVNQVISVLEGRIFNIPDERQSANLVAMINRIIQEGFPTSIPG